MQKHLIASRVGAFWLQGDKITPFEYDESPNDLIYNYTSRIKHETRIKRPCVRRGFLKGCKNRLNDEFIEISWDEALDLVAKNLKECYQKYGTKSIYAESYEWGGVGKIGWGRATMQRLIRCLGGGVFEMGDYSTGAGIVIIPHIFSQSVYSKPTDFQAVLQNAEIVVFWGANPFITGKIAHDIPMHEHEKYLNELAKSKKIIFVDTFINDSAKKMNAETILINSNTDAAMIIGMCHYIYTNKLYDEYFIANKTYGFDDFRDYFLGINDKIVKDLAWASDICGISEAKLKELAILLATKKSFISVGRAIQRQHNGEFNYLAIASLAAMCGHIGKDGLGIEFNQTSGCKGERSKNTLNLKDINTLLGTPNSQDYFIPSSRLNDALLNPGKSITYNAKTITYPDIKLLINACGSYFTHQPNTNESLKAWQKAECIITLEPFWNAQAKLSDIVLPIAIEGERYDIEQSTNKEIIFALKPIKEPFYEAKSDFEICKEIAKRFDKSYEFCLDLDEIDLVKLAYLDLKSRYEMQNINLPEFNEFMNKSFVKIDGLKELNVFTNHKNINKINLKIDALGEITAKYEKLDDKYPLNLSTPHSPFRLHSQLHNSSIRDSENGCEPALIHPKIAEEKGIKNGDLIKVFNDLGEIICGARITKDTKETNIIIYQGAWWQPNGKTCENGNVNVLVSSNPSSTISQSNIGHTCKVDIAKFNGNLEKTCFKPAKITNKT